MATLRRPSDGPADASDLRRLLADKFEGFGVGSEHGSYGRYWLSAAERMRAGGEVTVAAWMVPESYRQGFGTQDPFNLVLGEDGRLRPWKGSQ